jgi:HAD superfamily hydrolase (TIGR01509 family)
MHRALENFFHPVQKVHYGHATMTDLVIFDCDGVLIDSEVISATMLIAELKTYGVEITLEFVSRNFLGRSYPTVMNEIRKTFGVALPDQFEADYRARLLAAFSRDLRVMPGVRHVIDGLGVPFCLATSSSPERVAQSLALTGMTDLFGDRAYTASRVARGKPAPDLFLFAADQMGISPQRCLVIEDSLTGIRAARAAGMEVWRFTGGSHLRGLDMSVPDDARADLDFDNFDQFYGLRPALCAPSMARQWGTE